MAAKLLWMTCLLAIAGCGGQEGPERIAVSGKVERAGRPLEKASISYLPTAGHNGPAATTGIVDGEYVFTRRTGPVAGPHRVVIRLSAPGKGFGQKDEKPLDAKRSSWQFEADVPEKGPWENDFVLE